MKRLILILALIFVFGMTFAAYAEVQNVKVSGDITAYALGRNLTLRDGQDGQANSTHSIASIMRLRVDADLTDNVVATVRLLNERYWGNESDNRGTNNSNTAVTIDLAYATLKEFLISPLTVSVGRQELHFGNDMIVGAINTNRAADEESPFSISNGNKRDPDLSARKAFDAIRATLNYDPLVVDLVYAKNRHQDLTMRDDIELYGVNANYAINKNNTVEAYYFLKRTPYKTTTANPGTTDTVHTVGVRGQSSPVKNLTLNAEFAYQFGMYYVPGHTMQYQHGQTELKRNAWAMELSANYVKKDNKYLPSATVLYNFFSGDRSKGNSRWTGWDPMFENQTAGHIANLLLAQSNAHVIGGILSGKPMDDLTVKGEYYAYLWDKRYALGQVLAATGWDAAANLSMKGKKSAGQELDLSLIYDYTEDVQLSLLGGWFFPGNSFSDNNKATAAEVIGSMKVTF